MTTKYQVLSPDGFTIEHKPTYTSKKAVKLAIARFISKYKEQGYYSQTCYNGYRRQISIVELPDYIEINTI